MNLLPHALDAGLGYVEEDIERPDTVERVLGEAKVVCVHLGRTQAFFTTLPCHFEGEIDRHLVDTAVREVAAVSTGARSDF